MSGKIGTAGEALTASAAGKCSEIVGGDRDRGGQIGGRGFRCFVLDAAKVGLEGRRGMRLLFLHANRVIGGFCLFGHVEGGIVLDVWLRSGTLMVGW